MKEIKARKFMSDSLYEQWNAGHGTPKHDMKDEHNSVEGKIFSNKTYITYKACCNRYADWLKENGKKDIESAKRMVPEYLEFLKKEKSAWTVSTEACALAKAFRCSTREFGVELPKRCRDDVTRSRLPAARDKHFSVENNADLDAFLKASGLRREEAEAIKGENCRVSREDGKLHIEIDVIGGKGGKDRTVVAYGDDRELRTVARMIEQTGEGKIFAKKIHSGCDIHYRRSIYACRVYKAHARPIETLSREEKYACRKDMRGKVFDRAALEVVTKMLGHNRIDVVVNNYLYNL